jgi:hypothetical protein
LTENSQQKSRSEKTKRLLASYKEIRRVVMRIVRIVLNRFYRRGEFYASAHVTTLDVHGGVLT